MEDQYSTEVAALDDPEARKELGLPPLPEPIDYPDRHHVSRPARVLVVEDDPDIARFEKINLTSVGHIADIAEDGEEALEKVREERFDLILTGIMMPRIDGYELIRRLRGNRETRDVPILIVTGRSWPQSVHLGVSAGADDYMIKPLDPIELLAHVNALLRRREGSSSSECEPPWST